VFGHELGRDVVTVRRRLDVVRPHALVIGSHQRRRDDVIGRRPIARDGNVPDHRDAQQGLYIRIVRMWRKWIPEEDQTAEAVNPGETGRRDDYCAGETSAGLLIQAGPGKGGGRGNWRTKRSGWLA
jgi:hypothetical protein